MHQVFKNAPSLIVYMLNSSIDSDTAHTARRTIAHDNFICLLLRQQYKFSHTWAILQIFCFFSSVVSYVLFFSRCCNFVNSISFPFDFILPTSFTFQASKRLSNAQKDSLSQISLTFFTRSIGGIILVRHKSKIFLIVSRCLLLSKYKNKRSLKRSLRSSFPNIVHE